LEGVSEPLALQLIRVVSRSEAAVTNPYRELPSIDRLLSDERVARLTERFGHDAVVELARAVLDEQRATIEETGAAPLDGMVELLISRGSTLEDSLVHVINATGVVLHTNLGRAPLARSAIDAMQRVSAGYSTLEFDRESGGRGSRQQHLASGLCRVTGAEAAMVVNNNAAALLLALAALCDERGGDRARSTGGDWWWVPDPGCDAAVRGRAG